MSSFSPPEEDDEGIKTPPRTPDELQLDDFHLDLNDLKELNDAEAEDEDEDDVIIDKNEMGETSDDLDLLSSPSSKFSSMQDVSEEQEIDGFTNFNIILEYPKLNFKFAEEGPFNSELMDWFSSKDLTNLPTVRSIGEAADGIDGLEVQLRKGNDSAVLKALLALSYYALGHFGDAESPQDLTARIVANASQLVHQRTILEQVCRVVAARATALADAGSCETHMTPRVVQMCSNQLFYGLTVLHVVMLSYLKGMHLDPDEKVTLIDAVHSTGLLVSLTRAIDKWRWMSCESEEHDTSSIIGSVSKDNSRSPKKAAGKKPDDSDGADGKKDAAALGVIMAFKLRNVVIVLNDLILLEFGNLSQVQSTKEYLEYKYESPTNRLAKDDVPITPLDYRHYRDDLTTRYPTFTPPKYSLSHIIDVCLKNNEQNPELALSELTRAVSVLSSEGSIRSTGGGGTGIAGMPNMPSNPPPIHIATPLPSPRLTPQHTGGSLSASNAAEVEHTNGEVKKKLFMTQPNYPNIYPFEDESTKGKEEAPLSIKEATDIFYHHIEDDYHSKQFVSTFEEFVEEEQGIESKHKSHRLEFKYTEEDVKKDPMFEEEIRSLQRVESYYKNTLPYLSSLSYVLIQMISSNVIPPASEDRQGSGATSARMRASPQRHLEPKLPYTVKGLSASEKQRLEVLRMKETSLKSASSILYLLSQWFYLSHSLKSEYFNALLLDNNFILQSFRLLDNNKVHSQWGKSYDFRDPESLVKNRLVYCDYEVLYRLDDYNFFIKALNLSKNLKTPFEMPPEEDLMESIFEFKNDSNNESMLSFILPFNAQCNISVEKPNWRYCETVCNLFKTLYALIAHYKIQRIYKLLEVRPTDTLRFYLTLFNEDMYHPVLKIIKLMSPFSGKKWRANNMDMISFVFLFHQVGLQDKWLNNYFTGSLEERLRVSYENEYALRCLLKYYNVKNYPETLKKFGYYSSDKEFIKDVRKSDDEFFESEIDRLAVGELAI